MNEFILLSLAKLKKNKIPNPEIDLRILLNYSKNTKKEIILSNFNINDINVNLFYKLLNRRLANEPISKIINKKSFWKDDFFVNQFVLDPRPETEAIIEESFNIIKNKRANIKILDIGTGCGCILLSILKELNMAKGIGIDISVKAILTANRNANKLNLLHRSKFKVFDIDEFIYGKYDLGGNDGLDFYRLYAKKIPELMKTNSHLIIEIGEKQFADCREIFNVSLLKFKKKIKDLQKKDRIMVFSKL